MGAVKNTVLEFCEVVYPDEWDKQDQLFKALCRSVPITVELFRNYYETTGVVPLITLEDMVRLIKEKTE